MDIFVVVMLGVITLVAIIFAIRAKGETGKLTADNATLKASLEQAQEQARSADEDAKRVRELELENTRLEENLTAEKAESAKVNGLNEEIVSLNSENAKLNGKVDDLKDRLEERAVLEERFADSFKALSAETLEQQNKNFMDVADASLKERESAIQKLVDPLSKRLGELDQAVANSSGALKQQIETLVETNNKVASETQSLSNALSRPQVRGQWGEMQVERALELSGLQKGIHYVTQTPDQQGGRTDFIVHLPNKREIILDSKVSLSAYLEADAASDDSERDQHLQRHARHIRQHADSLAKKEYWNSLSDTADFVVMVVPEFALPPAVEREPQLLDHALSKNVVIVTYSTLVALLKCVAMGWQERNIAAEALKIGELGKELHDRIVTYTGHVSEVGKALDRAVNHYNQSVGSLESRVLRQARRFPELGIQTTKELTEVKPVEVTARSLREHVALEAGSDNGMEVQDSAKFSIDDLDREALVALYDATNGENWTKNTDWKTNKPLSEWFGVKTNSAGQVILLSLSDNALSGQIPKALGQLTNLKRLYLHNNALSGQIPKALGKLTNLERLWLFDNVLSGQIPKALGKLKRLKELALNNNKLSGGIPVELGQLTNLKTLVLSDNVLSGQIPKALGKLINLERLYLYNNRLSRHIPVELEQLTNLEERKEIWVRNNADEVADDVEFQT